ncbi:hypothetical protein QA584_14485 [Anaerocolumna sp. AGMB13025]|uniref:hypothetical protein n=1 Tax=Anaerocolumna sp. AGMB13025 TaxID=3039116 RepID=UPI00241F5FD2|nr:hypothetical protein [Anaerocolumna sp. AGMB13025]WFR54825.1 hypothetical protein QA584_14485 [Anaerocolumna sp. AGMB13025]
MKSNKSKYIMIILGLFLLITVVIIISHKFSLNTTYSSVSYDKLMAVLEHKGFSIDSKAVDKDILEGIRNYVTIDEKDNISVYLYKNNKAMERDAGYISPDGFGYDKLIKHVSVDWIAPPHFYKMDNMIVLYCGEREEIINCLKEFMGEQFAGQ